jgi:mRNA interferase RelE/StbE
MWQFRLTGSAERDIQKLSPPVARRVKERLLWFIDNFEETTPFPLGGMWQGFFKLRVGDWRVVYEVKERERVVIVHVVEKRDKVYKHTPPRK